jgi:Nuclease A inhibitor-like protein
MKKIIDQLREASQDLLFISESEYPFEVFQCQSKDSLTASKILSLTKHPANTPVEVISIDKFFTVAVTPQDWHEDEEQAIVHKFQRLVTIIKETLSNVQVYRVGTGLLDVYIVGKTPSGDYVGLSTKVVET